MSRLLATIAMIPFMVVGALSALATVGFHAGWVGMERELADRFGGK